jgi:TolB-like protein
VTDRSLFAELKRRNVIRMAGLYLVGAWLLTQVASTVFPAFDVPGWALRALIIVLAIGFVPALIFAWVFELTPEGIKRDAEVKPEESIAPQTARRMDRTIIVVLIIALVYFCFDKFVLGPRREVAAAISATQAARPTPAGVAAPVAAEVSPKSVAVLPFVNMSGDPKNEFFSDGITEEILNALAQIPDLKVAARTSAFAFKGKDPDLRHVGEVLAVAHVLEGSVQRSGDDVRITAQLIDTRSGFHLWSEKYDRKLTNIFAVEDEISKAIADKLQLQLAGARASGTGNTSDAQAHELYLRGLPLLAARGPGLRDAIAAFGKAVELDPKYAQAWGALAEAEQLLPSYTTATSRPAWRAPKQPRSGRSA